MIGEIVEMEQGENFLALARLRSLPADGYMM
jgi:hypothetical protein